LQAVLHQEGFLKPAVRESAGKRKRGTIGHHGSGTLRWIMLQVAARYSPAARAWYVRLKQRKPPQAALIALARKLLTAVWALLRHGVCFDENSFATGGEKMQDQGRWMVHAS
jgi:hypothetical protein